MKESALVLDFDGVICDSIDECFASSWTAYHVLYHGRRPAYMPVSLRRDFARLRPLVRGGADFMLIQEILDTGAAVSTQQEFDELARARGAETLKLFNDLFYEARSDFLERDRPGWLALNRIYPHVASAFARLPRTAPVYILSTKKPDFIAEILEAKGMPLPRERILHSGSKKKLDIVAQIGARAGRAAEATFIDDQIDHLVQPAPGGSAGGSEARIRVFLATWGYVKEDWLKAPLRVPTITPQEFVSLVQREYS